MEAASKLITHAALGSTLYLMLDNPFYWLILLLWCTAIVSDLVEIYKMHKNSIVKSNSTSICFYDKQSIPINDINSIQVLKTGNYPIGLNFSLKSCKSCNKHFPMLKGKQFTDLSESLKCYLNL